MKTKQASVQSLKAAFAFFAASPNGVLNVAYGDYWKFNDFLNWFRACLDRKINRNDNRKWRKLSDAWTMDAKLDAQVINNAAKRIRRSGRNILRLPEFKAKYPQIDNYNSQD